MNSPHVFHLLSTKPQDVTVGGTRTYANKTNFHALKGMAIYRLLLRPKGVREPHWHPNANELAYCLKGNAMVTIFGNESRQDSFTISKGEMFYVPSGYLHHIENIDKEDFELILAFSDDEPEDFGLSASVGSMTNNVLGNTWGIKAKRLSNLKRSPKKILIGKKKNFNTVPEYSHFPCAYKLNLEGSNPLLQNKGGSARVARKSTWSLLQNLSMYSLRITDKGMREPHWHPITAEMGFVNKGKARMTVLSPDGDVDTYELKRGDVYFIPKAYPHHIENIGKADLHFLVFFDQNTPGDIGFSAGIRAYPNEVLGATFNIDPGYFEALPEYHEDLLIVSRINPRD